MSRGRAWTGGARRTFRTCSEDGLGYWTFRGSCFNSPTVRVIAARGVASMAHGVDQWGRLNTDARMVDPYKCVCMPIVLCRHRFAKSAFLAAEHLRGLGNLPLARSQSRGVPTAKPPSVRHRVRWFGAVGAVGRGGAASPPRRWAAPQIELKFITEMVLSFDMPRRSGACDGGAC